MTSIESYQINKLEDDIDTNDNKIDELKQKSSEMTSIESYKIKKLKDDIDTSYNKIGELKQKSSELAKDTNKNRVALLETWWEISRTETTILQYKLDIKNIELDQMKEKNATLKNMKISINELEALKLEIKLLKKLSVNQRNLRLKQLSVDQILNNKRYIKF